MTLDEEGIFRSRADDSDFSPSPPSVAATALYSETEGAESGGADFSPPAPEDAFPAPEDSSAAPEDAFPAPEDSSAAPGFLAPEPGPFASEPGPFASEENEPDLSARILGIRLRKAGQVIFFPDAEHPARIGSKVVVQYEQGLSLGEVESVLHGWPPTHQFDGGDEAGRGRVLRLATAQDIAQHAENSILAADASAFCKTCIRQRELDMKLVDVEVMHDRGKIIFYFTAPSRIDFRELVKDLVRNYRTRIELRQIGVRHETQMVGAIGNCGMVCCCHRYLRKFAPVTIKMAKEQNLFLNPAKLSGMCGRLLCCLSFEQGNYEEFNRRCPKLGKRYSTAQGVFRVLRANLFGRSIVAVNETGDEREFSLEEWDALDAQRAESPGPDQHRAEGGRRERREQGRRAEAGREQPGAAGTPEGSDSGERQRGHPHAGRQQSRKFKPH